MKRKSTISLLTAILLVAAVLLGGCGKSKDSGSPASSGSPEAGSSIKQGGSFTYGITTEPTNLDPFLANSADTRLILFNIFEGLVKPDKDGNLKPAVAEGYTTSPDSLVYTFKVRNGLKFHNGNAVTADDVKFSLETAGGLNGGKALVPGLDNIQSIEAADASTVKINLKKPDTDFLPYLTSAIVPKGYSDQSKHPIGTGPFSFESYTPQQTLVLKKNPNYWQKDLPHLDQVTFKFKADSNALLLDLQAGSVDGASVDYSKAQQLGGNFNIVQANSNAVQLLALNNEAKPLNDLKVRQALSYAVDPDEIINTVTFGKGTRVGTPVIPGLKATFDSTLTNAYKKDVAKAKQLLSEAGYDKGFNLSITVPSNYQVHVDTAQVIVNQLKAIGVTATIKQVDWGTWLSQVYTGRQYEATIISVDGTNLSPKSFLERYNSESKSNFVNFKNPAFDEGYKKAGNETDANKRIELYKQTQQILSKNAASVYIQDIASFGVLKKGLAGYTPYPIYAFDASTIYYTK